MLCVLAKPNFVLCLVPALALMLFLDARTRRAYGFVFAVALPAGALLGWQAWLTFTTAGPGRPQVAVAPFAYLSSQVPDSVWLLAFKLALSVLFPVAVVLADARGAGGDAGLKLAWAAFAVGVLQAYLLAETGLRRDHGNFLWGAQIAAFVLFAASARTLAAQALGGRFGRDWIRWSLPALLLAVHAAVGVGDLVDFARTGSPFVASRAARAAAVR